MRNSFKYSPNLGLSWNITNEWPIYQYFYLFSLQPRLYGSTKALDGFKKSLCYSQNSAWLNENMHVMIEAEKE